MHPFRLDRGRSGWGCTAAPPMQRRSLPPLSFGHFPRERGKPCAARQTHNVGARPCGCPGAVRGTPSAPIRQTSRGTPGTCASRRRNPSITPILTMRRPDESIAPVSAPRYAWRTPPRTGAATRACPYGCVVWSAWCGFTPILAFPIEGKGLLARPEHAPPRCEPGMGLSWGANIRYHRFSCLMNPRLP